MRLALHKHIIVGDVAHGIRWWHSCLESQGSPSVSASGSPTYIETVSPTVLRVLLAFCAQK